jgi:inorganic pyrophosphatase
MIEVVVEIPKGSRNKYEYDEQRGTFRLDRVLYSSVHYPTDYGFVPETLAEDGDHLDALVIVYEPTFPGCHVLVRPVGVLSMTDEAGVDVKILAVLERDPRFEEITELAHVPTHLLREIENFFATYKVLEKKPTATLGWSDRLAALEAIARARQRWQRLLRTSGQHRDTLRIAVPVLGTVTDGGYG